MTDVHTFDAGTTDERRAHVTDTRTFEIPQKFYDDHRSRDLPTGIIEQTKARTYVVRLDEIAYRDLLSDADYYSDASQFDRELLGLSRSARATAQRLRDAVDGKPYVRLWAMRP